MSEYIGSRISLISKSDIRYIGTLHEINSDSSTVALESVTSHGTEGRKNDPSQEIAGSDHVYEYIVFRGSDVKELTIVSPPAPAKENQAPQVPNDPAILGSARPHPAAQQQQQPPPQQQPQQPPSHPSNNQFRGPPPPYQSQPQFGYPQGPPQNQFQQQSRFQGPGGPHGFPGSPGAVPGYGGPGYPPPPPGYGMGFGPPPGQGFPPGPHGPYHPQHQMQGGPNQHMNPQRLQQQQQQQPPQQQQHSPAGPTQNLSQPPDAPMPSDRPAAAEKPAEMPATPAAPPSSAPPPPLESKPSVDATPAPPTAPRSAQKPTSKPIPKSNNRVAVPLPAPSAPAPKTSQTQTAPASTVPASQPQSVADATMAATAAVAAAMAKLGPVGAAKPPAGILDNLSQQIEQLRVQDGQTRGRGRGRGVTSRGTRRDHGTRMFDVPKEDFDFESSNAKFNKQDLGKEAISPSGDAAHDEETSLKPSTNGDATSNDVVIPPKPVTEKGYDKKSSFFDNISSDLKDRAQNNETIDGRALRREERTKNVETFGQGSVDGAYRGGFRGRGRGGRGFGRGGRGFAPRGGFENRGGSYRGRGRAGAEAAAV